MISWFLPPCSVERRALADTVRCATWLDSRWLRLAGPLNPPRPLRVTFEQNIVPIYQAVLGDFNYRVRVLDKTSPSRFQSERRWCRRSQLILPNS